MLVVNKNLWTDSCFCHKGETSVRIIPQIHIHIYNFHKIENQNSLSFSSTALKIHSSTDNPSLTALLTTSFRVEFFIRTAI